MKAYRWLLPKVEGIFDDLKGSYTFTTLHMFLGYRKIRRAEECKEITTFVSRFGTFKLEVMLLVLMKAPFTLQRIIDYVMKGIQFARVYLDNVFSVPNLMQKHIDHLTVFSKAVWEAGMKQKITKCAFSVAIVKFHGHFVEKRGIRVDEAKIDTIKSAPSLPSPWS